MQKFLRASLINIAVLASSYSLPAAAVDFCVSTGAQLNSALLTAATNGSNDVIKIQSGTLIGPSLPQFGWAYRPRESDSGATLRIAGGYAAGCPTTNPVDTADATALDARNLGTIFSLDTDGNFNEGSATIAPIDSFSGQITLENLLMTRGAPVASLSSVNFVAFNLVSGGKLTLRNTYTVASSSNATIVRVIISGAGNALVQNNVIFGNNSSDGALSVSAFGTTFLNASNNSIFDNHATGITKGLDFGGTVNLYNNAVADNFSQPPGSYEAYCINSCSSASLRNNHFQNFKYSGSGVFSDIGTSTNNPQWTADGLVRIPNATSPLRDSGSNTPSGGLLVTDILGHARIINGTVDRGAVEAAIAQNQAPIVSAASPMANTATNLGTAPAGQSVQGQITFLVTGGNGATLSSVACSEDGGSTSLTVLANGYQTVAPGGNLLPVSVGFTSLVTGLQQGSITCLVTPQGAPSYQFGYGFLATGSVDTLFTSGFE